MQNRFEFIYLTFPLYVSIALGAKDLLEHIVQFFFALGFFIYLWRTQLSSFSKVYDKKTLYEKYKPNSSFAGVELFDFTSDHKKKVFNAIHPNPVLEIIVFILSYYLYIYGIQRVFPEIGIDYFKMLIFVMYFAMARYIGGIRLFSFVMLFIFGLFHSIDAPFFIPKALLTIFLFLLNLILLNTFYWKTIIGEKSVENIYVIFKKTIPLFVIMGGSFFVSYKITENYEEELNPNKAKEKISEKLSEMLRKNADKILDKNDSFSKLKIKNEKISKKLQKRKTIKEKIKRIKKYPNLTQGDVDAMVKLMEELNNIEREIVKDIDSGFLPGGDNFFRKGNEADRHEALRFLEEIKKDGKFNDLDFSGLKKGKRFEKTMNRIESNKKLKNDYKQFLNSYMKDPQFDEKKGQELFKKLNEFESHERIIKDQALSEKERKEMVQSYKNLEKDLMNKLKPLNENDLNALSKLEQIEKNKKQMQKTFNPEEIEGLRRQNQSIRDELQKIDVQKRIRNKVQNEIHHSKQDVPKKRKKLLDPVVDIKKQIKTEKEKKVEEEKAVQKVNRFLIMVFLLFIVGFLVNLFKKKKVKIGRETLSKEQLSELQEVLNSQKGRKFENFHEELDEKYKIFHKIISIIFYPGEVAPPALIIPEDVDSISSDTVRKKSKILGLFFNSLHYAKKKKYSGKEQKLFRKAFSHLIRELKAMTSSV